jgi:hypothetical protein
MGRLILKALKMREEGKGKKAGGWKRPNVKPKPSSLS